MHAPQRPGRIARFAKIAIAAGGLAIALIFTPPALVGASAQSSTDVPMDSETDPAQPRTATQGAGQNTPTEAVRATLSRFGTFVPHPKYGEVWSPKAVPVGWHPYEACHWVNSRRYGWYFDDKRPWGEIVHHYGRWTRDPGLGWIWVPGAEWSPGWVVWRSSPQWIGWAPQLPDEDLTTVAAADFNAGDTWTFMDVVKFNGSCSETQVSPAVDVPTILGQTQYVTEIDVVSGIAIFVLPTYVIGPLVDISVSFTPWTPAFYFQLLIDIHAMFNDFDAVAAGNFVDCTKPVAKPVVFTPTPLVAPRPVVNEPPRPPVVVQPPIIVQPPVLPPPPPIVRPALCADGTLPPCRLPPPPPVTCPRGSHPEGERCVANVVDLCPDGAPRDFTGRCRTGPPPFVCPNGSPPDRFTGSCGPSQTTVSCPAPLVLRNGLCTLPGPVQPPCPGGVARDPRGQCPQDASTCRPPLVMRNGVCALPSTTATCPNGSPPDPRTGQCASQNTGVCAPPLFEMRNGNCVRVGGPTGPACPNGAPRDPRTGQCGPVASDCRPPRVMVGGVCRDVIATPRCDPPRTMREGQCVDRVVVQPSCLPPRQIVGGQCVDRVVQPSCLPPRTMRDGQCVQPIASTPVCSPPMAMRDGRCAFVPRPDDRTPSDRRPNGPFDSNIRHPSQVFGQNGNNVRPIIERPPAFPVQRTQEPRFSENRPPVVFSRGGGGQNMFNPSRSEPSRSMPSPAFHPMPEMHNNRR